MTNAVGINPSPHEIERQLERILADEDCARQAQPAKLLAFVVKHTLAGEKITEKLLREHACQFSRSVGARPLGRLFLFA